MNKTIGIVLVIVVLVGGFWMFKNQSAGPTETGPIKIGFVGPLTGDVAALGNAAMNGVKLAVDEAIASGQQVEVVYEDTKCSPTDAVTAANKLMSVDKVSVIIGGLCSSETSAFAPAAMQNKVPVIAYCSSAPSLSSTGKYFFRTYPSDANQGKFAAEYAYNTLKARKVAVVYHITEWGTGIKDVFVKRFKELGGEIVLEEGTPQEARDYRTQLAKIKTSSADYLYAPTYPDGGTVLVSQIKETGLTIKVFGADGWGDPKFHTDVSGKADILYSESIISPTEDFKTKFLAKAGGEQVPICAPQAYDAVKVYLEAVSKVGTDPDKVADALRKVDYQGQSGNINFDDNGDVTVATYIVKRIANGTATEVK